MAENLDVILMVERSGPPASGELTYPEPAFDPPEPRMKPGPSVLLLAGIVRPGTVKRGLNYKIILECPLIYSRRLYSL